ncbi:MAG: oligosaccharide flippase family protein [Bacteroidales bacterium]|nr:oligosaccharide flippase family protein [Bacteroidales bacterium]
MAIRNLVGQTAIYGLPTIIGRLLNYLLVPLYTRLFIPSEYGIVGELYAWVALVMVIATYGMETAFFRFVSKEKNNPNVFSTAVLMLLTTSITLFSVAFLFRDTVASAIGYANHSEYIVWFAAILALDAICMIPFARLRNQERPIRFAFLKTVNIATNIGFNLFFLLLCPFVLKNNPDSILQMVYRPEIGVGYIFISNLLASSLVALLLLPEFLQIRFKFDQKLAKTMLIYALPVMIWGMAGILNETFDRIFMKYLIVDKSIAMAQVGIYTACYKVAILMSLFIQAFRYAADPFFFKQAENPNAPEVYAKVMRYFVLACLMIFLVCSLFLNDIIRFIGPEYREGAVIVPILLMANLFLGVFYNLSVWYKITDKTKYGAYISFVGAVITISLNILLVPIFGYIGAAWATLICYVTIVLISYWLGQRHFPIPYPVKVLSLYTLGALTLYIVHHYVLDFSNIWINRGTAFVFIACFMGIAWWNERKLGQFKKML